MGDASGEGYIWRRVVALISLVALVLVMSVVGNEHVQADDHQFLLCSGPGETKRSDGSAAVPDDYIIVVNSRNFAAITDANDQVPEDTITDDDVQSSGGSYVRSDLSWGMYIPSGYVYQEAGTQNCVINLKFMMRERGDTYFKEAVLDFDNTAPCQGRVWLNTSRDTTQDAAVCPRGAPASTSGTNPEDNGNSGSDGNSNTNNPVNTVNPPGNSGGGNPPGNTGGGNPPGNTGDGNPPGNTGGNNPPGNTGGGNPPGNTGDGDSPGNTGGGDPPGDSNGGTPGDDDNGTTTDDSESQTSGERAETGDDNADQSEDDLLESEADGTESSDLMEVAGDGSDSEDMLETEAGSDDDDTELRPQETVRPDVPKTGTGGVAADRDGNPWTTPVAAAAGLAVLMTTVVLFANRRFNSRVR